MHLFITVHINHHTQLSHEFTVTKELLVKRAEHNDGDLSTLEEITLHQYDIEKIELLDVYCKRLRILYLQSNQIMRIGMCARYNPMRLTMSQKICRN